MGSLKPGQCVGVWLWKPAILSSSLKEISLEIEFFSPKKGELLPWVLGPHNQGHVSELELESKIFDG